MDLFLSVSLLKKISGYIMGKTRKHSNTLKREPKPIVKRRVTFGLSTAMIENIKEDFKAFNHLPDALKSCEKCMIQAVGANKKVFELLSESMQHRVIRRKKGMIVYASLNMLSSDLGQALLKDNPRLLVFLYRNRLNGLKELVKNKPELLSTLSDVKSSQNSCISLLHHMIKNDLDILKWASENDEARQFMVRFFELDLAFFDHVLKHSIQHMIFITSYSLYLKSRLLEVHYEELNHLEDNEILWKLALETCRNDGFRLHAFKQLHADKRFILSVLKLDHHDGLFPDKIMAAQYISRKLYEEDSQFIIELLELSPQSIMYIDLKELLSRPDLGESIINHVKLDQSKFIYSLSLRFHRESDQQAKHKLGQWSKDNIGIDLDNIKQSEETHNDLDDLMPEGISSIIPKLDWRLRLL